MYLKGDAELVTGPEEYEKKWFNANHPFKVEDSRESTWLNPPVVVLPHSCGKWVIGDKEAVLQMIWDLSAVVENWPK